MSFIERTLYEFIFGSFKQGNEFSESKAVSPKAPSSIHEHEHWVYTFSFMISQPRTLIPYINLQSSQFNNCPREVWRDAAHWGLIIFLVAYVLQQLWQYLGLFLGNAREAHHQQILCINSNLNLSYLFIPRYQKAEHVNVEADIVRNSSIHLLFCFKKYFYRCFKNVSQWIWLLLCSSPQFFQILFTQTTLCPAVSIYRSYYTSIGYNHIKITNSIHLV